MHQEFEAPEELQHAIKCFWYDRRDFGEYQTSYDVQPDGYAEIIFYFGSLQRVDGNGNMQILPSPFIMGLLNRPATFYTKNCLEIIGVRCFPWTVFDLMGMQPGMGGVHIFQHPIAQLQPAMDARMKEGKVDDAIAIVKQYLLYAQHHIAQDSMLYKAGVAMRDAKGIIPVSRVAAAAHATVRTLERNFKQSSGHTVKDVAALMRFEQVRNQLWVHPNTNLAGLAAELGYTDQSHLSREFKRYSGTTPAAFARKAKQEETALNDFVAFVQA